MPSKRQPSKQRRAAQNRARAQALAARREAARQLHTSSSSSSSSGGGGSAPARRPGLLSGLLGGGAAAGGGGGAAARSGGLQAMSRDSGRVLGLPRVPGAMAVLVALAFSAVSFVFILFYSVPVDDRDEPLPPVGFHAVYLEARSILTGERVTTHNESVLEVFGPAAVLFGLVPLAVVAVVYITFRRSPASRPLTFGMIALAVGILFPPLLAGFGTFFMPSLIALAVGSFQARRAELPARMAERDAARDQAERDADEEDEELPDDEYDEEDEYDEDDEYLDEDEELADEEYDEDEELADEDEDELVAQDEDEVVAQDEDVEEAEPEGERAEAERKPARGNRKR